MIATQLHRQEAREAALIALGLKCLRRLEARSGSKRFTPPVRNKGLAPCGRLTKAALARLSARVDSMSAAEKNEARRWLERALREHERKGAEIARHCVGL